MILCVHSGVYVKFNKPHYFVGEMAQAMLEVTVDRSANVSFTVNFTTNTSDLIGKFILTVICCC